MIWTRPDAPVPRPAASLVCGQALEPAEPVEGAKRHHHLASVHGYSSPTTSRSGSTATSCDSSPTSSRDTSRDSSPMRSPMRDSGGEKGGKPKPKSGSKESRRMSSHGIAGPGVPEDFREAAQAEASRSHEWRQKLVRLVAPPSKSKGPPSSPASSAGDAAAPAPSTSGAGAGAPRPLSAGAEPVGDDPSAGGGAGPSKSWPSSFNMRGNMKVDPNVPTQEGGEQQRPQQAGAPPLSALHRPKMRL